MNIIKTGFNYYKNNKKLNTFDFVFFFRQLATLLKAGISLVKACEIIEQQTEKLAFQFMLYKLKQHILAGKSFYDSMQAAYSFCPMTCQLIRIGEQTGRLDNTLAQIAHYFEIRFNFKNQIIQILLYPSIVFCTAIVLVLLMLIFVVPRFIDLFAEMSLSLPPLTRLIFIVAEYLPIILIFFTLFLACLFLYKKNLLYECAYLVFKKLAYILYQKMLNARFARNLATTCDAGLPIMDAILLSAAACNDRDMVTLSQNIAQQLNRGVQLSKALEEHSLFSPLFIQLVRIGEDSGTLVAMLNKVADWLEADIDRMLKTITQFLEPLIMILLGVLIGGLMLGLYLPIFQLGSTF